MRDDGEPGMPPLSREKERERAAAALQAAQPLPTMSELGGRHQACPHARRRRRPSTCMPLQPPPHTIAASATHGCSLRHTAHAGIQACLTADDNAEYTPLDEAVVRMVERGKSTEVSEDGK